MQGKDSLQSRHIHKRSHCGAPMCTAVPGSGSFQVVQQLLTLPTIQYVPKSVHNHTLAKTHRELMTWSC